MRKLYGLILISLIFLSFIIAPNSAMASFINYSLIDFEFQNGNHKLNFIKKENISSANSILTLSTDKESYYRGETVSVTATLVITDETPVPNATITYEMRFPNNTLWFVWTDYTDQEGVSTLTVFLGLSIPSGEYQIYASSYKVGLGNAYATLNFTVVNQPPQISSVEVIPRIIETPTTVRIRVNATDFEDGLNIHVKCIISMPNETAKQFTLTFDGTYFTLAFPVSASDAAGIYSFTIIAEDSEGGLSNPYHGSFENAILITRGALIVNVIDSKGMPVFNATLFLIRRDVYLVYDDRTDRNGYAAFDDVTPGDYILKVSALRYAENSTFITVMENQTKTLSVVLKRLPVIKGYIISESGKPIINAQIEALTNYGLHSVNYTDEDGFFILILPSAGTFLIKASAVGYSENSTMLTIKLEEEKWLEFTLKENGLIKGRIVDKLTRLPIVNATVFLSEYAYLITSGVTDQHGNFSFLDVPPGNYVIRAIADGYLGNSCSVSVGSGETVYIELELTPAGKIYGSIFDADTGLPIQGARVALINPEGTILTVYLTDENGTYCFSKVKTGNYTLKVYAYGYNSSCETVYVPPYTTTEVNFYLVPNMIFVDMQTPSDIYSRGETIEFSLYVTNPSGQSIIENITEAQLSLINPLNESISINLTRNDQAFTGSYPVPSDAPLGMWLVAVIVMDIHGNVAEEIKALIIAEAFYIRFETDRKSYTRYENVTFFATVAKYSNLSCLLGSNEVNVTVSIIDEFNNTLVEFPLTDLNGVFSGAYTLGSFQVGNYTARLYVTDNMGNAMTAETIFKVVYDFTISVYTDKNVYNRTENVKIYGFAVYETSNPVSNSIVSINLKFKDFNRYYSTKTDETGYFEFTFKPSGLDAGNYTVSVSIISNGIEREVNEEFVILGLILKPSLITVKMSFNSENNITLNVGNIGETTLTDIYASISPVEADGITAEILLPPKSTIKPGEWSPVTISLAATLNSTSQAQFIFKASSRQGAIETAIINVYLYPAVPIALVKPQIIETSLNPSGFSLYSVNVTNVGYGEMINVHLTEPNLPWVYLTATDLGNINPSATSTFDIIINPSANVSAGVYEDQIAILSDNHKTVYIYLLVTITLTQKGALLFHVTDEFGNSVSRAEVILQYQEDYTELSSAETNATGYCLFANLTVGRYSYLISKEGYHSTSGAVTVTPGEPIVVEALLPVEIMDVSFEVEPITIQDQYIITLNLTFQTEIPPPVLIPVPPTIQYTADRAHVFNYGYAATTDLTIINTGEISVYNVTLYVDYTLSATSSYSITFLDLGEAINIEEIDAKESVSIPVTIQVKPGTLITDLPQGLIGKIKIQGYFIYFDPESDIPHRAKTQSEVLVYIFDVGERRLCVDPSVIYGINREGVVSFSPGTWPNRLPDVVITNCAEDENIFICTLAVGGGVTVFVGLDLMEILRGNLRPVDVGGFVAFGIITRYGGFPGEGITLVDAEDTFGLLSVEVQGGPLFSLLLQALILQAMGEEVIGLIELSPSEAAILQSEMWDIPTSWSELFEQLIGFKVRVGAELTIGGILFCYKWQFDASSRFYLVPILIVDVSFPTISIPLITRSNETVSSGGTVVGVEFDQVYVFHPPSIDYETRPIVRRVEPTIIHTVHETVKLSISQEATLERDAFAATLKMKNKLSELSIQNVNVDLRITDINGSDMMDKFYISRVSLENVDSIDGTGTILPNDTATVRWIIIPKIGAGGDSPDGKYYFVQAFITYTVDGRSFSVNSTKELINVKPQPLLVLEYYVPSEVKANQPFKLAVKVTNVGNGTARNVQIDTAQPVIYDNVSGLRIEFQIIGSAIKGQPAGKSLRIELGDIPPGGSIVAYWIIITTLDGTFLDFSASFIHLNALGGTETSLIKEVRTSILMRDIKTDELDFLFLIDADGNGIPDELLDPIFGDTTEVVDVNYTITYDVGAVTMLIETQKFEGRWIFVDVEDPYSNLVSIVKIVRSDGKELDPSNYWMANGKIYFLDDPEQNYTIFYNVHDVAITDVSVSSSSVFQGETVIVNVTVTNQGISPETFNLTLYINSTILSKMTISSLEIQETRDLTFYWNTTGFQEGTYILTVNASILLEEFDVLDNSYPSILIQVKRPPKAPLVIIDRAIVSGSRVDVNSTQTVSFHASWDYGADVVNGKIYVNGTEYVTNQTGWISFHVRLATVGKKSWAVTGVDCNGITNFTQIIDNPFIIWDKVQFTLTVSDNHIDVGSSADIEVSGIYAFDSSDFSGFYSLNDTLSKNAVGKYYYTIDSMTDTQYGLTVFESNVVYVIFDRININSFSAVDNRINVGDIAEFVVSGVYEFNNEEWSGTYTLNDTTTKNVVGKYWYTIVSVTDSKYGLTTFIVTAPDVYVIFDEVNIVLSISDNHIDVGTQANITYIATYEYDNSQFSGVVYLNDTLIKNEVGKYGFTVGSIEDQLFNLTAFKSNAVSCIFDRVRINLTIEDNRIDVGSKANITWTAFYEYDNSPFKGEVAFNDSLVYNAVGKRAFSVRSISDPLYGLKKFVSNTVYCIWDKIIIYEGKVSHSITNITQTETVWLKAKYAYDGTEFTDDFGVLYINGSAMSWSPIANRWERQFNFSTTGTRIFVVSNVIDKQYGLTYVDDKVGPLKITWVTLVYYIPKPPHPGRPIVINATEILNIVIIIENISDSTELQVEISTAPPPPPSYEIVGNPYEIHATGRPTGIFKIRIYYSEQELENFGIDEKELKIFVWNGTEWIPLASSHINPAKNYVEAVINHFSVFALLGRPSTKKGIALTWILVFIGITTIFSIAVILLVVRRRKQRNHENFR